MPEYERICLIDTDTLCTRELKELWEECSDAMMLYPVNHSYEHNERKMIRDFYRELREKGSEQYAQCPEQLPLPHYGGEFFCGPAKALREFTEIAKGIFFTFKEKGFPGNPNFNDEHVFSIAAALYRAQGKPVLEAAAYIWRYWTEKRFYLVATNTVYNPVCIWHVPGEKDKGMLLLYRYFLKHGEFPDIPGAAKLLGIAPAKRPYPLMSLYAQWVRRCAGKK